MKFSQQPELEIVSLGGLRNLVGGRASSGPNSQC